MLIDRDTENLHNQRNEFRISRLKLICLENIYNRYQIEEIQMEDITNF